MDENNPQVAIRAITGRAFHWRGKSVRNCNLALIALQRLGLVGEVVKQRIVEAASVLAYVLSHRETAYDDLADGTLLRKAISEADDYTPEELGQAVAMFGECMERFGDSAAVYSDPNAPANPPEAA